MSKLGRKNWSPIEPVSNRSSSINANIDALANEMLLAAYQGALNDVELARIAAGHIEQEIIRRMRDQGAIAIPSDEFTCELETKNTYDQGRFTPIKELLSRSDLETVLTPEYEETRTVREQWNTVKLLALARRYGGDVKRIVEEARIPGAPRLIFQRR